ncbi:ABC transporter permease [Natrarchaeobaculum sulfurireducens]|uniref:ABC-type antimicrobial peptide transport system,permease component n=1 Tax=Natrarchaeobaculum sulfurireducens TaxID=2044521 RepID=A0A346PF22_9EURY|nr:ABC transporter permease [Natrarchaeobaculum sulfurireducens]AXR78117.1 ABC-type antimicrobial peptide transport system,permease component [Natrarchaeobaculum sulfurireducens]
MVGDREGTRHTRWAGIVSLSVMRLWKRATRTRSGRVAAILVTVALTTALLLMVTGVALALADGGTATDDDATVEVVPDDSATLSAVDGVERPRLGETNERAASMHTHEDVDHASPVLAEPGRLEAADGDDQPTVLLVGVVADGEPRTAAGLPTDDLEPGDPHYANGSYDGVPEGEMVLSEAAANRLGASEGDELDVPTPEAAAETHSVTLTVAAVEEGADDGDTDVPVALVQLSELQSFTGADDGQLADRVIVWGEPAAAESAATEAYPDAAVESNAPTDPSALFDDGLALATSLLALLVGIVICSSFVATTAGMTVNDDRRSLAVLESVGIPRRGRLVLVAVSTLVTTVCGALLGAAIGIAGIQVVNALAAATIAPGTVALIHPLFVPYAVGVALVAGLLAMPYPLAIAARTSVLEEVRR